MSRHRLNRYGLWAFAKCCWSVGLNCLLDPVCSPNSTETAFMHPLMRFLFAWY